MQDSNGFVKFILITIFFMAFIIILASFSQTLLPMLLPTINETFTNMGPTLWIIIVAIILVIWFIATYNKFVSLAQKVNQSAGGIDVYLKQRFDLIPNLVETVKGYAKYEESVLDKIVELRSEYNINNSKDMEVSAQLNNRYNQLIAVVENYPELKANEGFLNLQKQLSKIESQLQAARRIYNFDVTEYNTKLHKVPSNIVAKLFGFKDANLFEISAHESNNVDIKL